MKDLKVRTISVGSCIAIWAVPLSGYGHVADEQPLPYIQCGNLALTPRFGGEEDNNATGIASLPLPYGKLSGAWPLSQRLFNLPRRRVNIYWRNIFNSFTRTDGNFYFAEQLHYSGDTNGFSGRSPLLSYERRFIVEKNSLIVSDQITALRDICFAYLMCCPWAEFGDEKTRALCTIKPSLEPNHVMAIESSTGSAYLNSQRRESVHFHLGDTMNWHVRYCVKV